MTENPYFDLSNYVIQSINSPLEQIETIYFEPFTVELRTEDTSLYVFQINSDLNQCENSSIFKQIQMLSDFQDFDYEYAPQIIKDPIKIEKNNVNGCKFDKIIYIVKNGVDCFNQIITSPQMLIKKLVDSLNSIYSFHKVCIAHNEIDEKHILFANHFNRWQLKESMKSFKYEVFCQSQYLSNDILQLGKIFMDKDNSILNHILKVMQQIKTLIQLEQVINFLKSKINLNLKINIENDKNSLLSEYNQTEQIRNFKVSMKFFEKHDQAQKNQTSFNMEQLIFIILIENLQNHQNLNKWLENFDMIILNEKELIFFKYLYELLFRMQRYNLCNQVFLLLLTKYITVINLDKLTFNSIFALELQTNFAEALTKYKKLYQQTQDIYLKMIVLNRIGHIYQDQQNQQSIPTYKEILLNQLKMQGFNNIRKLISIIYIIAEKDKRFQKIGCSLEIIENSNKFSILKLFLEQKNTNYQNWLFFFLYSSVKKDQILEINYFLRGKILNALYELGFYIELEEVLDLCLDNFRLLNFQEHSDIIILQIKMLMACGFFYLAQEKTQMILQAYDGSGMHFGNVDTEHCNVLLAYNHQILKFNYQNLMSKQLKTDYPEFSYLKYKQSKQEKEYMIMLKNVDLLMTNIMNSLKQQKLTYLSSKHIAWKYNSRKSINFLKEIVLPFTINQFGINHIQVGNQLYLLSKLFFYEDEKLCGLKELQAYLLIIFNYIQQEQLLQLMAVFLVYEQIPMVYTNKKQLQIMMSQFFISQTWNQYLYLSFAKKKQQNIFIKRFKNILKHINSEARRQDCYTIQINQQQIINYLSNQDRIQKYEQILAKISQQFSKEDLEDSIMNIFK